MNNLSEQEKDAKRFERWNVNPPSHESHNVTLDELADKIPQMKVTGWYMTGNMLHGQTEHGEFVQNIPPQYIMTGTDKNNLPIFKEIDIT